MLRRLGGIVSVDWLQRLVRCIVNRGKTWLDRVQSKKVLKKSTYVALVRFLCRVGIRCRTIVSILRSMFYWVK